GIEASSAVPFDLAAIKADARNIAGAVKAKATNLSEDVKSELERASTTFVTAISVGETAAKWAATATAALDSLRQALATADVELTDTHPRRACARSPRG